MSNVSGKCIEAIEIKSSIGEGIEGDPCRIITEYFSLEGKLLATKDEWLELEREKTDGT